MTESHYVDRDGVRLHYEVSGPDSHRVPLLLTHGYGASTVMWGSNLEALTTMRQVITWDVRGHGTTVCGSGPANYSHELCVADMAAILDACGADRAVIGGLSLGGYLSLSCYLAHPDRVEALLLFDTGPGYKDLRHRERWNAFAESTAQALERDGAAALPGGPETRGALQDPNGLAMAARGILTQHDATVIDSLPLISVPTMVLVGELDTPFLGAADYMVNHVPGAVRCVIQGAGHVPNIDQPFQFNRAVKAFLDALR